MDAGIRRDLRLDAVPVGTFAIQLAKHVVAVVATTTSTANLDWVKALGADIVIDYRKGDFATTLRDYDVVLNSLGGEVLVEGGRAKGKVVVRVR